MFLSREAAVRLLSSAWFSPSPSLSFSLFLSPSPSLSQTYTVLCHHITNFDLRVRGKQFYVLQFHCYQALWLEQPSLDCFSWNTHIIISSLPHTTTDGQVTLLREWQVRPAFLWLVELSTSASKLGTQQSLGEGKSSVHFLSTTLPFTLSRKISILLLGHWHFELMIFYTESAHPHVILMVNNKNEQMLEGQPSWDVYLNLKPMLCLYSTFLGPLSLFYTVKTLIHIYGEIWPEFCFNVK